LLDHILEHLELADAFDANAARVAAQRRPSKHSCDLMRCCREQAEGEHAEAAAHAAEFGIHPLVLAQELATWRRLRQHPLDRLEVLTVADVRWLRSLVRHGGSDSRNVRRAAELLCLAETFLGHGREDDPPPSSARTNGAGASRAGGRADAKESDPQP
jgi:hypothetical protein